jgi:hypothetical protein
MFFSYYFKSLDLIKKYAGIAIIAAIITFKRIIVIVQANAKIIPIILKITIAKIIANTIDNVFFIENKFI